MAIDRMMIYDLIYALAASNGRDKVLFGSSSPLAREAFRRSLAGDYFPELWFEIPLAGDPWFDLHALVARGDLDPNGSFEPETCGNSPESFAWFAAQKSGVRQLALSWDVSAGDVESPAVQLLTGNGDPQVVCAFLEASGRADATHAYRVFHKSIPWSWCACYAGMFPRRTVPFLRVECIPKRSLQSRYAQDASLLERHLTQVGLTELGDTLIPRCQELASMPFPIEFQFDVTPEGRAGDTFSASLRFSPPPGTEDEQAFLPDGAGGELMRKAQEWGLVDERWHELANTAFAKQARRGDAAHTIYCYPAFLKLRWREGIPVDAKAYLVAGIQ